MLLPKCLFYFIILIESESVLHINLYSTDLRNQIESDDNALYYNCLRVTGLLEKSKNSRQIVSYCMNEFSRKYHIEKNDDLFFQFTFDELAKKNITSHELYLWSASIDLIEDYQFYLNQLSTSNDLSLANQVFSNCTLPRFGYMCEYELKYFNRNHLSLYHIIRDIYLTFPYKLNEITCYMHLKCHRGPSPSCLDWTEICDGKIDCYDTQLDEKHCWQLEVNECHPNEYRCFNGQCIPNSFIQDNTDIPDCLHASDVDIFFQRHAIRWDRTEPLFGFEDIIQQDSPLTSSYVPGRDWLLFDALFSVRNTNISDECWSILKYVIQLSNNIFNETVNSINKTCPDVMFIPSVPVLYNDIYLAFKKQDLLDFILAKTITVYVCSNNSRYNHFFTSQSKSVFNNLTCHFLFTENLYKEKLYNRIYLYINSFHSQLRQYSLRWKYTNEICNKSIMYLCENTSECISMFRLIDGMFNCPNKDDEDRTKINEIALMKNHKDDFFKCPISNKYILKRQINDIYCDCYVTTDNLCEDETPRVSAIVNKEILFPKICDGFIQVLPILIDGQNHTDETECEYWPCDNVYTDCNNIFECFDGSDEVGCYVSSRLNCSSNEYLCISPVNYQFMCLSLMKINDGRIDCLGAFDEPNLCPNMTDQHTWSRFVCAGNESKCLYEFEICSEVEDCYFGDDEHFCHNNLTFSFDNTVRSSSNALLNYNPVEFIQNLVPTYDSKQGIEFSLDGIGESINDESQNANQYTRLPSLSLISNELKQEKYCHRGFDLVVWLNHNQSQSACVCPASYYGDRCQYQNERISLALQFQATSHSWQTLFAIIVSLADNQTETIHSYEKFTYLPSRDCNIVFNTYLLYSTRPKHANRQYSINIDIYEKFSLAYRSSFRIPIQFAFLPVHRLPLSLRIPGNNRTVQNCFKHQCLHGKCFTYSNNSQNETFCQCYRGWSGRYCTIPHVCQCSLNSLCIGVDASNRSVCVCPMNHFGPRCLIIDSTCTSNSNSTCQNAGRCIPNDEYILSNETFTCICPIGFYGKRCELVENRIQISIEQEIYFSQVIFIHFIEIRKYNKPRRATTFQTIISKYDLLNISWSQPFHLIFIEMSVPNKNYYFIFAQKNYIRSTIVNKKLDSLDRCRNLIEIFNETIRTLDLIRRIKYYNFPCEYPRFNLSCFYDENRFCLCQKIRDKRVANCFEFDHNQTIHCSDQSDCQNHGQCFLDRQRCPTRSVCHCPVCFYGSQCQFHTSGFALSLDTILGYHISPKVSFAKQLFLIKLTLALTIIFVILGFVNGLFSIILFKNKTICCVGCGWYLFCTSVLTLFTTIGFGFKFSIWIFSQLDIISNQSFLSFQCYITDFFLRILLSMDQWLNACITLERTLTIIKGTQFDRKKSKKAARYVVIIVGIVVIASFIHDPIHRHFIEEENHDGKRKWCIIIYSDQWKIYDSIINSFHVLVPFIINIVSSIILITKKTSQQLSVQKRSLTYKQLLKRNVREHKNLLIAPVVLVLLALPRIIIAFAIKCMKSMDQSWIFLCGYFLSFIPPMLTFVIFTLPSKVYKKEFRKSLRQLFNIKE